MANAANRRVDHLIKILLRMEDQYLDIQKKQRWHSVNPRRREAKLCHDQGMMISDADVEVHKYSFPFKLSTVCWLKLTHCT